MFLVVLEDGSEVSGANIRWHDLPANVTIKALGARIVLDRAGIETLLCDELIEGFDSYGFQMYQVHEPGNEAVVGQGVQFLCVAGDRFLTVDVNLVTGQRRSTWKPLSEMTYRRDLLRCGISHL